MDNAELLEQLADIHPPGEVSLWPPAPGWWLLGILLIALLIWLVVKLLQARRQRQICAYALQELDAVYHAYQANASAADHDDNEARLLLVNEVNAVLRRVALWHFPTSRVASLGGRAWVDFIREKGDSSLMTDEIAAALEQGRFRARCEVDPEQLQKFGEKWLVSLYESRPEASRADSGRASEDSAERLRA